MKSVAMETRLAVKNSCLKLSSERAALLKK